MSGPGVDLSPALVKSAARSFDLESVFSLSLSGRNLRQLHPCLNECAELWDLDLSSNQLTGAALSALDATRLPRLKNLNLSCNRLDGLAALPGPLLALQSLRLEGNALARLADLAPLRAKCPNLRALFLRSLRGDRSNPVCALDGYREHVLALLPGLQLLDGQRVEPAGGGGGGPAAFYSDYAKLEASTAQWGSAAMAAKSAGASAQPAASAASLGPVADWFEGSGEWKALRAADVDAELAPRVQVVRSTLAECARLLTQECDATLREFEKKYPGAAAGAHGGAVDSESPRGNGNSSTFGFGDDD